MKVLSEDISGPEAAVSFLQPLYSSNEPERVGFLLKDGRLVEMENIHPDPEHFIDVHADDTLLAAQEGVMSWHTHPQGNSNLSPEDYEIFLHYPEMEHVILGRKGCTTRYVVEDGAVLIEEHQPPCE